MRYNLAKWQVWKTHYNPSFYKLIAIFNTRSEADQFVKDHDIDYWDEENGDCGLVAVKVRTLLLHIFDNYAMIYILLSMLCFAVLTIPDCKYIALLCFSSNLLG